ncbi:MAG: hypothetical protein KAS73_06820 [Candidatus Sabulitectum sp.]|nr:hypothetical protein [Candidatus Sabulitectum sp.]
MKMKKLLIPIAMIVFAVSASAEWFENFDSYDEGSGIHGQGGWEGWCGNPDWDTTCVTTEQYNSAPQSLALNPESVIAQPREETSGIWTLTLESFIPSGTTGNRTLAILCDYPDADYDAMIFFDADVGIVYEPLSVQGTAMKFDQWVEVEIVMNLDENTYALYYDNINFYTYDWPGSDVLAAISLNQYSASASTTYWDDFSLVSATSLQHNTWASIKSTF